MQAISSTFSGAANFLVSENEATQVAILTLIDFANQIVYRQEGIDWGMTVYRYIRAMGEFDLGIELGGGTHSLSMGILLAAIEFVGIPRHIRAPIEDAGDTDTGVKTGVMEPDAFSPR